MRLAGIITEYDPFHAGHAWQLRRARELGAQVIAVCMSEDLTQRGSAALLPPAVAAKEAGPPRSAKETAHSSTSAAASTAPRLRKVRFMVNILTFPLSRRPGGAGRLL